MTPIEEERRGERARQVLENEIYIEAFRMVEERLVGQMAQADIDRDRAEYLRQLLVANRVIRRYLEQVLATGTMAAMEQQRKSALRRTVDKLIPR